MTAQRTNLLPVCHAPEKLYAAQGTVAVSDLRCAARMRILLTSSTDANSSVGGDHFEDNIEGSEDNRILLELACLNNGDEEDSKRNPPQVMAKLPSQLLSNEVRSAPIYHL
jgi:hypothetical protein